jgi:hypothetical protein
MPHAPMLGKYLVSHPGILLSFFFPLLSSFRSFLMSEWISRLCMNLHGRRISLRESVSPPPALESFEKVKLVHLEDHDGGEVSGRTGDLIGDRDKLFLPASFLDDVPSGDGDCT